MKPRLLCVPNFSEGRNEETIHAIARAAAQTGVRVHHLSWDVDHHRMVLAFSGTPTQVKRSVLRAGAEAIARIDLNQHQGAHPRLGAVDVVPFVPLQNLTREQAIQFSHEVAVDFARRLQVPVYLYEHSAREGRPRDLPTLRKGGFESDIGQTLTGEQEPDFGPNHLHPTAGATVMGVRDPLIAFNVNLQTDDPAIARTIAQRIRTERETNPVLKGVRALGLYLPTRQVVQVSLNLTRPDETDLGSVFQYVQSEARLIGVEVAGSELVGVLPQESALRALGHALKTVIEPGQMI
jgi:glutamate formiminotransferase